MDPTIQYHEAIELFYFEEIFKDTPCMLSSHQVLIGDINRWEQENRVISPIENISSTLLTQFINYWCQSSKNSLKYDAFITLTNQLFAHALHQHRLELFYESKYDISLESIASINEKRGSHRLNIKESFFKLLQRQDLRFEMTHKSQILLEIIRYILRICYDYLKRMITNKNESLHHRRYERAMRYLKDLLPALHNIAREKLQNLIDTIEQFQQTVVNSEPPETHQIGSEGLEFPEWDDLFAAFEEESKDQNLTARTKRSRTDESFTESTTSADQCYYSPSSASSSIGASDVMTNINNTLTLIQKFHPHRLEDLSRYEKCQLFAQLYPQLYELLKSQDVPIFERFCIPILKVVLAYQYQSKDRRFYIHYFIPSDLVNKIDHILNPVLPNMAPEAEEDVYLCQVRDPSFFTWLRSVHPEWIQDGHQLILHTFSSFYLPNWGGLLRPSDMLNPTMDYIKYLGNNLLYHLFELHDFETIKSLIVSCKWLASIRQLVGCTDLLEQLSPYVGEILVDCPLPQILTPHLKSLCNITHSNDVTLLMLISFFLKQTSELLMDSEFKFSRYLVLFLCVECSSQPIYSHSAVLTALHDECVRLINENGESFLPVYLNQNIFDSKVISGGKLVTVRQSLSKNAIALHQVTDSPASYKISLVSFNSVTRRPILCECSPSDRSICSVSDIYFDETSQSIWIACELSKQGGWSKYWCLQQYSSQTESSEFSLLCEHFQERFKIDKILHVSFHSIIIYEEMRGILEFSSNNGQTYQFCGLVEYRRRSDMSMMYGLSSTQFKKQEEKDILTLFEMKEKDIFIFHHRFSNEVHLWSLRKNQYLASIYSEEFLHDEIGIYSECISKEENVTENYLLILYSNTTFAIYRVIYYQLALNTFLLCEIPAPSPPCPQQLHQELLFQRRYQLSLEMMSSRWFPYESNLARACVVTLSHSSEGTEVILGYFHGACVCIFRHA